MDSNLLKILISEIVKESKNLKDRYTDEINAPVNYVCIFSHSNEEYENLLSVANELGEIIKDTLTGPLFKINPIDTISGPVKLLKIRVPDETRPERGDADFTVSDYFIFKQKYLGKEYFSLIQRENMEMIELYDKSINYRAYFSFPTLEKQFSIN